MSDIRKPPLGVMPKEIFDEQRKFELKRAISERIHEGFKIPLEWIAEWNSYH